MRNEVLRLEKVTLREQGVTLLDNLNLHIFEGEIMGLVPIDTHGLTALCDLLRENLPLHYGYVFYREKLINTWRSPQPHYNRISVIQAKSCLVDGLSVADNIFVLRPRNPGRRRSGGSWSPSCAASASPSTRTRAWRIFPSLSASWSSCSRPW